jgi:hypothetical protein
MDLVDIDVSQGSLISIVTGHGLDGWGLIPGRGKRFFFLQHRFQTGCGIYPASFSMGTRDYFPRGKVAEA